MLNKKGTGSYSDVISGINKITSIKQTSKWKKMVANLSLSGGYNKALNDVIGKAVDAGVIVIGAAGNNDGKNACSYSPGSSKAIVVGAIDENGKVSDFSNVGA